MFSSLDTGVLEAIWIKRHKRGPMDRTDVAVMVTGRGIVGNANQGGRRQVTVISREAWAVMLTELGAHVDPSVRRANLLVSGIDLARSGGAILTIGEVRVRLINETRPCARMDEAFPGLRRAMGGGWRGGAFGEVLDDGQISVGDTVRLSRQPDSAL